MYTIRAGVTILAERRRPLQDPKQLPPNLPSRPAQINRSKPRLMTMNNNSLINHRTHRRMQQQPGSSLR